MDAASSRRRQSHQDASVIVLSSDEDGPALLKKKAVRSKKPRTRCGKSKAPVLSMDVIEITSSEDDLPNESKSSSGLVDALQQQLAEAQAENGKLRKSAEVGLQQLAEAQAENGRLRESAEVGLQQLVEAQAENGRLHKSAEVGLYPHDFWTIILTDIKSILEFRKRITS
ncbi:hypothetical protein A0H81_10062 [Grifola frondosa]|uniref:Uncharacterized protein n=1 Tax=Grifola frondosa TaxID=5627 RepID=A0A1C7LZS1_GRIFR|nr:hypothetical protein A0H81_10062 [Grifola frondosa]